MHDMNAGRTADDRSGANQERHAGVQQHLAIAEDAIADCGALRMALLDRRQPRLIDGGLSCPVRLARLKV